MYGKCKQKEKIVEQNKQMLQINFLKYFKRTF